MAKTSSSGLALRRIDAVGTLFLQGSSRCYRALSGLVFAALRIDPQGGPTLRAPTLEPAR